MTRYRLTRLAEHDLLEIYGFTADKWNEAQADKYLEGLKAGVERLVEIPSLGTLRNDIDPLVRGYVCRSHVIFYRIEEAEIQVLRVIHKARDAWVFLKSNAGK